MPLQLTVVTKQLKRVMWYPTQTFGYLLFTFFTPCKNIFFSCLVHICASVPGRSALPRHLLLLVNSLKRVGLPCIMWWVDPSQKPNTQSVFPSSSRRGEKAGKAGVRKPIGWDKEWMKGEKITKVIQRQLLTPTHKQPLLEGCVRPLRGGKFSKFQLLKAENYSRS